MKIILFFALASLAGYIIGYLVGRWTIEQKIERIRQEMQTDEEEDPYSELFK